MSTDPLATLVMLNYASIGADAVADRQEATGYPALAELHRRAAGKYRAELGRRERDALTAAMANTRRASA